MDAGNQAGVRQPWRRSLRCVFLSFLVSRLLIFGIWACVACVDIDTPATGKTFASATITLDAGRIADVLHNLASYNDAGWYAGIAHEGYEVRTFDTDRAANWAFFPLHPLLWRGATAVLGNATLAGLLLSNLLFLAGLLLLHRLVLRASEDTLLADRSVVLLAFWPTSYFFSLPWSESLFLLLSTATFLAAMKRQWGLLLFVGAAACACRFAGIFLVPALFVYLWPQRRELPARAWAVLALIPTGLALFMLELWRDTGNAYAFSDIQIAWGRHLMLPYKALGVVLIKPHVIVSDWNFRLLNFATFAGASWGAYWLAARARQPALACFLMLGLLAPAMTGSITSMARYGMGLFPLAIAAAYATRRPGIERLWMAMSGAVLALLSLAFVFQLAFAGA